MPLYELTTQGIAPIDRTSFASQHISERGDLQRHIRDHIEMIAPGTLVLAEEFGAWEDSRRRIDLLCLDADGSLVVVELKRTEDAGHVGLQAVRYAAMVSTMTFEQAVRTHAAYLKSRDSNGDAETAILSHLGWEEPDEERN